MKKLQTFIMSILVAAMVMGVSACSNSSNSGSGGSDIKPADGNGLPVDFDPFEGTTWYGTTKDFFTDEIINDVKLLVFDKVDFYGRQINRCQNLEDLYFGGSDGFRLVKGQKLPYTVERKSDGSYVATVQLFNYLVVIPSADSTTGYISVEHNNQTLKININKK